MGCAIFGIMGQPEKYDPPKKQSCTIIQPPPPNDGLEILPNYKHGLQLYPWGVVLWFSAVLGRVARVTALTVGGRKWATGFGRTV